VGLWHLQQVKLPPELQEWIDAYEAEERRLLRKDSEMARFASDTGGGDFKQAPAGNHVARCIRLTDLGTQHGEYQGEPTKRNQVLVTWELPLETVEIEGEQRPLLVSKFYTNSLGEKANLRKDLESWRARPFTAEELMKFDLEKILGAPCMVSVIHNEKGKATVATVAAMAKGTTCPPAINEVDSFWLEDFNHDKFESISDGIKKIIMESDEYKAMFSAPERPTASRADSQIVDDIPF
jgi:hypothetical protein